MQYCYITIGSGLTNFCTSIFQYPLLACQSGCYTEWKM